LIQHFLFTDPNLSNIFTGYIAPRRSANIKSLALLNQCLTLMAE